MPKSLARLFSWSSSSVPGSTAHEIETPIDEELIAGDRLKYFHPTKPGDVLDGRFKTIAKLGFGGGSTVWLAENLKSRGWIGSSGLRYVSIKIPALDTDAHGEIARLKLIQDADPSHEGRSYIRLLADQFDLPGPEGTHRCLVYEPMRETMAYYQFKMPRERLILPILKLHVYILLQALDYLHTRCHLIHTDIKDENIMMTIESDKVLQNFVKDQERQPQPRHVRSFDSRETYLSHIDLGPTQDSITIPKLSDFNIAYPGSENDGPRVWPIQSHRYRAPEVILGCPWSYSVDIWNLGLLMWDMLENTSLFGRPASENGEYDAHVHLAQMVSLLGPPPPKLIMRERVYRHVEVNRELYNSRGQGFRNMNKFWGGPFFDKNDQIRRTDLVKEGRRLRDTITELTGDEKQLFLDFARNMLQWLPEDRKTARELLSHRFFDSVYKDRDRILAEHAQ